MRRRSEDSRREDAASTRTRLVDAGVQVFARHDYDEASVREIARIAGVNISMVGYHFEGKAGLYAAVTERVVEVGIETVGERLHEARAFLGQAGPQRQDALLIIKGLLGALIETTRQDSTLALARIMLRGQMDTANRGAPLHEHLVEPYVVALAALLAVAEGRPQDRRHMVRAFSLVGQVIVFRVVRFSAARLLTDDQVPSADDVDLMMELIANQLEA